MSDSGESYNKKTTLNVRQPSSTQNLQTPAPRMSQKFQHPATRPIESYRDLVVWQKAMDLGERCYRLTRSMRTAELFALGISLRRSAVSIPSNIAEGHNRRGRPSYRNHVAIAMGSQAELETQLELGKRVGTIPAKDVDEAIALSNDVGRLLFRLYEALK